MGARPRAATAVAGGLRERCKPPPRRAACWISPARCLHGHVALALSPAPGNNGCEGSWSPLRPSAALLPEQEQLCGSRGEGCCKTQVVSLRFQPCIPRLRGLSHSEMPFAFAVAVNHTRTRAGERLCHWHVAVNVPQRQQRTRAKSPSAAAVSEDVHLPARSLPGLLRLPAGSPFGSPPSRTLLVAGLRKHETHLAPSCCAAPAETGCWQEGPRLSRCWRRRACSQGFGARRCRGKFYTFLPPPLSSSAIYSLSQDNASVSNSARRESRRMSFFAFLSLP